MKVGNILNTVIKMNESILVIEDNTDIRENIAELLELAGYNVLSAIDGKDGLNKAKANKPALILCDIMMPGLDGYGVLKAIENLPDLVGIPFVFLTAKSEKSDFRQGMGLGADDYLTKPFEGNDLLKVVDARLKKNQLMRMKYENNLEGLNSFIDNANKFQNIINLADNRQTKRIKKKEQIFMEDEHPKYLYFVVSGKLKMYKTNEQGKEFITDIFKPGDFFGYIAMLDDTPYKESAIAIENSEIAMIPKEDFFKLLYSNNEVSLKFLKFMSNNFAQAEEKLINLAYNSARKRVAEALLFLLKKYRENGEDGFDFPVSRENISAIAGIAPESVSRNLSDFKSEGLIEILGGKVRITNYKKLENLKN